MGQPFPNFYQNSGHRNGGTLYSLALIIHNRCQPSGISQTWPENRTFSRPGSHSLLGPHRALTACFAASVIVTSANPLPQRDSKASFESLQVQTKPRVFQNWHHRPHFFFSSSPCLVYFSTFLSLQESAFPLWELFTSDHFQSQLCQPPAFFISLCLSASPSSLLGLPKHILRAQHDRAALHHVGHSSSTPSHHTHCSLSCWLPGGSLVTTMLWLSHKEQQRWCDNPSCCLQHVDEVFADEVLG